MPLNQHSVFETDPEKQTRPFLQKLGPEWHWIGTGYTCFFNVDDEIFVWDEQNCRRLDQKTKKLEVLFQHPLVGRFQNGVVCK